MSADALRIREAWRRVPTPGSVGATAEGYAEARVDRLIAVVVAFGSLLLGGQAALSAMAHLDVVDLPHVSMLVLVFGPLIWMLIACVIGRTVRLASGVFTATYALSLALWPVVVVGPDNADAQPWIFFLVNVGVAAAVVAFRTWAVLLCAVVLPLLYGWVRLVEGEFSPEFWVATGFDVIFTLILGLVVVSLAWMFRSVARGVDAARSQAVTTYAAAAGATAQEEERVALAALMHDSVLAALIAAGRADSDRERTLAVAMSREALTRLANTEAEVAEEGSDEPALVATIVAELRRALSEQGADAIVEPHGEAMATVPGRVARAMVLAARQAITNALQHAAGKGLHVVVVADASTVTITVSDAGTGFELDAIGEDRLGIRASIFARMAAVAGLADIDSDTAGTTVTLQWSES